MNVRLMLNRITFGGVLSAIACVSLVAIAQPSPSPSDPPHRPPAAGREGTDHRVQGHGGHDAGVNRRGDQVMGFDHGTTTHHFRLRPEGGLIEVEANDPRDTASRDRIRAHLRHIAVKFANGDFTAPMLIHARTPPGVPAMIRLKEEVRYQFEESERGGRVRITTRDESALTAIHEFLRFQIEDHQTDDSKEVENPVIPG
ncbi:MAG: hypothetical protein HY650_05020 [Acidobacteria bacterium]|nr:hypothetical protein [Acidobacteriota bacterium]